MSKPQKVIPCRFLYDIAGSRLFESITRLPEYYLTRCETEILERRCSDILALDGGEIQIVEFGSGSGEKTRILLTAAIARQGEVEYVPIDISAEFLQASAQELLDGERRLAVTAVAGDYLDGLKHLPYHKGVRLFLFLGSSIGNFDAPEATAFLGRVRDAMRPQDRILVGVDLKKAATIIEPAYNDSAGVTERFNKNLLVRINRELCGRFDIETFRHEAPWIESRSRVEMRLVSTIDQIVDIEGLELSVHLRAGEFIHTEDSYKWSEAEFCALVGKAGMAVRQTWKDAKAWFALTLLEAK